MDADIENILDRVWIYGSGSLMVKIWSHIFNLEKDHFRFLHLWVLLPNYPLAFWNIEACKAIGDSLGKFLYVDSKVLTGKDCRVGRILVKIYFHMGLPAELEIEWKGLVSMQRLEYWGISFHCSACKEVGHLKKVRPCFFKEHYEVISLLAEKWVVKLVVF
jgi:hypothetical protein